MSMVSAEATASVPASPLLEVLVYEYEDDTVQFEPYEPPPPPRRRRRWVLPVAILSLILGLVLVAGTIYASGVFTPARAPSSPNQPANNRAIGANVLVTGDSVPLNLEAHEATGVQQPVQSVVSLGPVVEVTPGGKLPGPTTLTFKLSTPVKADTQVYVAWRSQPTDEWDVMQAKVAPDGTTASIVTDHLSWYWPFRTSLGDMLNSVKQQAVDALMGDSTEQAEKPTCKNEDAARKDNYSVESNGDAALYWCFGIEKVDGKDQRIVRIVNRMRYPIRVKHLGFQVPKEAKFQASYQLELQNLGRLGSGEYSILFPFDSITYTADLGTDEGAKIETEYDGFAQNLHRMDIALSALSLMAAKLGGKALSTKAHERWKILDDSLGDADCYNAVMKADAGGTIVKCFNPSRLKKIFDWRGILLSPLITAGTLFNWLHGEVNSLFDQLNDRSKYVVLLTRANQGGKFLGEWHVHGMTVTFDDGGKGKITQNAGPCNDGHMCTGSMDITWKMDGSALVYTVASYKSVDETGQPSSDTGAADGIVGKSARVEYVRTGFLKVTSLAPEFISNHYLCGKGVSQADQGECGA